MALSIVGTPPEGSGDNANITLTLPGGIAEGDVVIVAYANGDNSSVNNNMAMSTGGYTELADIFADTATRDTNMGVFRKVMGSTPDSTAVTTGFGGSGAANVAVAHVWRGADTTTPEDQTTATNTRAGDGSTGASGPAIVTQTADAVVLTIGAASGGTVFTATTPTNYGNLQTINLNAASAGCTIAIASRSISSPGSEDPAVFGSFAPASTEGVCEVSVAIRPAPSNPIYTMASFQFFEDNGSGLGEAA